MFFVYNNIIYNSNKLLLNHLFNFSTTVFISFSNLWVSGLIVIKLVSSTNKTGLDKSDMAFGRSLTYRRRSKGPSMDP
jgi:hypothetical protein